MILNFRAYWNSATNEPFINEVIPMLSPEGMTLADYIRTEVVNYRPSETYADTDIKAVKSASGMNATRILTHPVSMYLNAVQKDASPEMNVVIDSSIAQYQRPPGRDVNYFLMAASKPTMEKFESKWSLTDVIGFQSGYEAAPNKGTYLTSLAKEGKPSIDEQVETYLAQFMNDSDIGFKSGTGGEEKKANDVMKKAVGIIKFVHERQEILGRDHRRMYNSSELLRSVRGCVKAKVNHERSKPLYNETVTVQLRKAEACLTDFPSSYYRKVATDDKYGAAILKEVQILIDILGTHLKDMIAQDLPNQLARDTMENRGPASFNTSSHVVKSKM